MKTVLNSQFSKQA